MERYNGWTNRATWLCFTWIMDFEYNYNLLRTFTMDQVAKITVSTLQKNFYFGDRIHFDQLDMVELIEALSEHVQYLSNTVEPLKPGNDHKLRNQ
jgi:hypothetical protein